MKRRSLRIKKFSIFNLQFLIALLVIFFLILGIVFKGKIVAFFAFFKTPFEDIAEFSREINTAFQEKLALSEENKTLKETVNLLKGRALLSLVLEKELQEIEENLGRIKIYEEKPLLAKIIIRPPQTFFESLFVDLGEEDGIKKNMKAIAYGHTLIGRVEEVYKNSSKIKLISEHNNEENVFLEPSGISAIARGMGNHEFLIELPSSLDIKTGERVLTLSPKPYLIGIVDKIEKDENEPLQKLHIVFPFNINGLRSVFIIK